ncbi:TonB-dependent receptor domain-containing protein [Coraliomargarita sinensis]|nr:TonB-dependent receptor [Coraliomargarita sinensis]
MMIFPRNGPAVSKLTLWVASIGFLNTTFGTSDKIIDLESYVMTGSNFKNVDASSEIPITRIDNDTFYKWGDQSAYTALLDQPYSYGYANSNKQTNGGTGSAGANLRGLGNLNTLTLINGRRAGGNSAIGFEHGGFADLNLIPIAAIREMQVAVDGTSVAYGSDAVAGTVNLLLHQDYIGERVDASYSNTTDGDASEKSLSFLTGQQINESTHLVLSGSWYERNAIFARDRHISENADFRNQGGTDQRSDSFPGRLNANGQSLILEGGTYATSINDYTPYSRDPDGFNYNTYAPTAPTMEQKSVMAHVTHQLTQQIEIWTELLYTETSFENGLAPAPWSTTLFPDVLEAVRGSPHRPDDLPEDDIDSLSYRNLELGNMNKPSEKQAQRLLLGLRGELDRWDWEAAVMQIQSRLDIRTEGLVDKTGLIERIDSGFFNPFAMAFARGTNDGLFFNNAAALREEATSARESFKETYRSIDFMVEGPAFELPAGELNVLLGAEFREEEIDIDIDPSFLFPGIPGAWSGYSPYEAERSVFSVFGESITPLLGGDNGDGMKLNLHLAARYENYTDESASRKNKYNQFVYKAGFEFIPIRQVTIRGSFGTAFRAPTLNESFNTNYASLVYNTGSDASPNLQQFATVLGANPNLEPEQSNVLNLGITYEPDFAPGLTARVNYYRIETRDAVNHNGQQLVNEGATDFIFATRFNTAEVLTDGVDYQITYRYKNELGQWEASAGINQVFRYEIKPSNNSETIDFLGRLVHPLVPSESVQGPGSIPEYKGYARLIWNRGSLTLGATLNYIHSLDDNPIMTADSRPREIDSWTTLDLIAQYAWSTREIGWLSGTTLTLGIENVTDEAPPFAAGAFADGYDSSLYNLEGRRISLSLRKEF